MGAYKQFLASDIIITPFEVHKGFYFTGSAQLTGSDVGIDRFLGTNVTTSLFESGSDPITGQITTQYQRLVYNSIKELYYSNYLSSSYGSTANFPILIPGADSEGDRLVGSTYNPAYENYLQTTLSYARFFPTQSEATIGVLSIPSKLFGDFIQPNSVLIVTDSGSFTDDGEGNLISGSQIVGNVIYTHGIITLTGNDAIYAPASSGGSSGGSANASRYASAYYLSSSAVPGVVYRYGANSTVGGSSWVNNILNLITSDNISVSFSSSYIIHETQYKCTIRENEFNFTLNPSAISGSYDTGSTAGTAYGFVTESYFSPYITTVGLYDEDQNLLAVGKLSQPVPSSPTTDTTILINLDR